MKKFLLIWVIILLLIVFQTSLLAPWFSDYFYPDLVLVSLISSVAIFGFQGTWIWVVLSGLTTDIFAYSKIGTHVIIFSLTAYGVSFISRRFAIGDRGVGIIFIILLMPVITALDYWGVPLLNDISLENKMFTLKSFYSISTITLMNLILFLSFYPILLKFKKKYSPAQYKIGK